MQKWFYTLDGKNLGPLSSHGIADAVLKEELDIDTSILSDKDGMWKKVKDVPEIMDIIHKPLQHPVFDEQASNEFVRFVGLNLDIESTETVFYNLPARQFLLAQIITLGMFEMYWFYKQWNYIRKLSHWRKGSFFLVTLYHIFFAYEVFKAVETNKDLHRAKRAAWNSKTLAILWYLVVPLMAINPLHKLPYITGVLSALIVFPLTTFVLMPVQRYINEANEVLNRPVSKPSFGFYVVITLSIGMLLYLFISLLPG